MVIYKYPLEITDKQIIKMPHGFNILSLQMQYGRPCIWAMVNPDNINVDVTFRFYGTGHQMDNVEYYVGTVQEGVNAWGAQLVWHLFVEHISVIHN